MMELKIIQHDVKKEGSPYESNEEYLNNLLELIANYLEIAININKEFFINKNDLFKWIKPFKPEDEKTINDIKIKFQKYKSYIESRVDSSKKNGIILPLEILKEKLDLSSFEIFCMICSLSCYIHKDFQRMFSVINNTDQLKYPTFGIVKSLFKLTEKLSDEEFFKCADNNSNLSLLIENNNEKFEDSAVIDKPIILKKRILNYINLNNDIQKELLAFCNVFKSENQCDEIVGYENEFNKLVNFYEIFSLTEENCVINIEGPAGIGKKLFIKNLAKKYKYQIIFIEFDKLLNMDNDKLEQKINDIALECLLNKTYICISDFEEIYGEKMTKINIIMDSMIEFSNFIFTTSRSKVNYSMNEVTCINLLIDYPKVEQSIKLWSELSKEYIFEEKVNLEEIANKHILTPLQIKKAIKNAFGYTILEEKREISSEILIKAIFSTSINNLRNLAKIMESKLKWDDLIINEREKDILYEFCNRVKYRGIVNEKWNKSGKLSYGMGISLLLYGPPGTGKTMTAQVIANELQLELYRIDLSQIISKYIGETTKNIDEIFNEAKNNNVILFFDEADALFTKRTEVSDSTDKYANADTAHLLQKIEEFTGVTILATNLVGNFDEAFKRRINYMVNIRTLNKEERKKLWESIFPDEIKISDDIDFEFLAEKFELSASDIKSIAIQASFFSEQENCKLNIKHIIEDIS